MTTTNDITGDALVSKSTTESYRDGWDRIFGKKELSVPEDAIDVPNQQRQVSGVEHSSDSGSVVDDVGAFVPQQMNSDGSIKKFV